jgi:hypothetical protein
VLNLPYQSTLLSSETKNSDFDVLTDSEISRRVVTPVTGHLTALPRAVDALARPATKCTLTRAYPPCS